MTRSDIHDLLFKLEAAAKRTYPPATLDIHASPERLELLALVVEEWVAVHLPPRC